METSYSGTSGISVTAKRNGQTIDVAGSSISLQIGSVDEMIINGNFEDVTIPNGTYWAIYDTIPGWTGPVEIQVNNGSKVAELDTDSRYSGLDPSVSDHQPHHTTITSYQMDFTPGLTYTLSFDAWNRSDYAQDNILNVTVPGEIISVNGNTPVSTLLDLIDEDDLGAFSFTSISYNSVTFSAGGNYYETDDGNGGTVYTLGASPFHVSSITFIAANDYGTVSFSDVSSDVVPCYGPLLDNISMNQEYLYVDIDVDSNNDGVINGFDDTVEMAAAQSGSIESGAYGYIVLAGEQFSVNLNTISSRLLDGSIYGVRLLDSEGILDFTDPYLHQSTATITAEQAGQTALAYEIYLLGTNQVVARDEVLITVNTPPHLRAYKDDSVICETEGYETGDYSTVAEIFHDANDNQSITTIDLNSYFHDKETPDELLYSIYSSGNSEIVSLTLSDSILDIQFTDTVGQTSITVQATDPLGASETWTIDLYNVRIIGYEIKEKAFTLDWSNVEDRGSDWSLHWQENKYQWTPILESDIGKNRVTRACSRKIKYPC